LKAEPIEPAALEPQQPRVAKTAELFLYP